MNSKSKKRSQSTFVVEVKQTQHSSWQGTVTWVDEGEKKCFRSALELLRMIDGVVNQSEVE